MLLIVYVPSRRVKKKIGKCERSSACGFFRLLLLLFSYCCCCCCYSSFSVSLSVSYRARHGKKAKRIDKQNESNGKKCSQTQKESMVNPLSKNCEFVDFQ